MKRDEIQRIVDEARAFLIHRLSEYLKHFPLEKNAPDFDPEEILDRHLKPRAARSLDEVMRQLLFSAQNRHSMPKVILGAIKGGLDGLRDGLGGYDPKRICARWKSGREIFRHIKASCRMRNQRSLSKGKMWQLYCDSILSGATFLSRFDTFDDFKVWVSKFLGDRDTEMALPLILAEEIKGFGLALACDFLKEIGYVEFGKPDVQLKRLLAETGISDASSDYLMLRDLISAARAVDMTPYAFDKIFWLIGSGRFYLEPEKESGKTLSTGRQSKAFLKHLTRSRKHL